MAIKLVNLIAELFRRSFDIEGFESSTFQDGEKMTSR